MTVEDILNAWKIAADSGGFYEVFERLTGFSEYDVRRHFVDWNRLRHEIAEEIAEEEGVTIRSGGFQAYLAAIKRSGHPPISAILGISEEDDDPNPRPNKPWPRAEDCLGCDGRAGAQYQHRFGCSYYGARGDRFSI